MVKPILGYWNLRGRAEPIRYILHYKNVDFEDKKYPYGEDDWKKLSLLLVWTFQIHRTSSTVTPNSPRQWQF
ncbi:hypothetical protein CEXT_68091 [Caerostris extrusa]|uniref:GST N-terminal domain-containing protein n=1 Tax=Caerostris extrusa TaxID=172846 RepID=A0AAV4UR79_CAEEX|nr:hypothetical protein CEXT_68091 [Caerostris extrusa]